VFLLFDVFLDQSVSGDIVGSLLVGEIEVISSSGNGAKVDGFPFYPVLLYCLTDPLQVSKRFLRCQRRVLFTSRSAKENHRPSVSTTRVFDLIWSMDPFRVVVVVVGYLQDIA